MKDIDLFALLTWAVRDQMADRDDVSLHEVEIAAFSPSGWRTSRCGCAAVEKIGHLGVPIDGSGQVRGVAPRVHEDAERVVGAVRRLSQYEQYLVLSYARKGQQPRPWQGKQKFVPIENHEGGPPYQIKGEWEDETPVGRVIQFGIKLLDAFGQRRFKTSEPGYRYRQLGEGSSAEKRQWLRRWCPVRLEPEDSWIKSVDKEYDTWHSAMSRLLVELRGVVLTKHRLVGFSVPPRR